MREPEVPHWALVLWPMGDPELPSCISLDGVLSAIDRGAKVIAREDDLLPFNPPYIVTNKETL